MGFNIAVITVNKNVKNDFEAFSKSMGLKVLTSGEVSFEEASSNRKVGYIDALFTEKGSLLFVPMFGNYEIENVDKLLEVAFFIIDETSNTFRLLYAQNGKLIRIYTSSDGEIHENEGQVLLFEEEGKPYFMDKMSLAIKLFTGKGMWDFENDISNRYKIVT
jgi:hypothetical protein